MSSQSGNPDHNNSKLVSVPMTCIPTAEYDALKADILYQLWQSSEDLHKRFDVYAPLTHKALRVMTEEFYETVEAALTESIDLPYEVADLIVTAMGVMMSHFQEYADLEHAINHVISKNNAKTTESHEVNSAGKIARKG